MRKGTSGFTLIELLAVIVILAIIALIAVPIVLGIINDSKTSSEKESVKLYLDTVTKTIGRQNLKGKYEPDTCTITNGDIICQKNDEDIYVEGTNKTLKIEMKGEVPSEGTLYFTNGKITTGENILLNGLYYQVSNANISEGTKEPVDILTGVISRMQTAAGSYTGTCEIQNETTMVCGSETKTLSQSSHKATEGIITFNNGEITSYKNIKMEGKYYHNINGKQTSSTEKRYAVLISDEDNDGKISIGDKYTYDVNDTDTFTFYVLSIKGDEVNLIMDSNICNDGTIPTSSKPCTYAWHWQTQESDEDDNRYGPDIAMTNLYNATKDWTNVPDMIMNYEDENNKTDNTLGYTGITTDINTKVTTITGKQNKTSQYQTFGNTTEPLKARLPREDEVTSQDAGCHVWSSNADYGTCSAWLVENLKYKNVSSYAGSGNTDKYNEINSNNGITNIYGYWLLSSYPGNTSFAHIVDFYGIVGGVYKRDTSIASYSGLRAVITVSLSDISN